MEPKKDKLEVIWECEPSEDAQKCLLRVFEILFEEELKGEQNRLKVEAL